VGGTGQCTYACVWVASISTTSTGAVYLLATMAVVAVGCHQHRGRVGGDNQNLISFGFNLLYHLINYIFFSSLYKLCLYMTYYQNK
jgi:hypothetical protein